MDTKFVKVRFGVKCKWEGFPPEYRIYVNDELFSERAFTWNEDITIKEMLQVQAVPGIYKYRLEALQPETGKFTIADAYVEVGEARVLDENRFQIL